MSNGDYAEMSEAVLDAGPLIHLAELEALDALMGSSALFYYQHNNPELLNS